MSHFYDHDGQIAEAEEDASTLLASGEPDGSDARAFAGMTLLLIKELRDTEAAVARVREVHQPLDALHTNTGRVRQVCTGCGTDDGNWQVWPCPTIRTLNYTPRSPEGATS